MDDPNKFFTKVAADPSVDSISIGGRKGKTVIINDQHGYGQRIKPNKFQVINTDVLPPTSNQASTIKSNRLQKDVSKKVKKCLGKELSDVELNGEKIFENLNDRQRGEVSRKLGGTAKNNSSIVNTAHSIAEEMGCKTLEEFLSLVELVAKKVEGKIRN